jgi:hypothetical protein
VTGYQFVLCVGILLSILVSLSKGFGLVWDRWAVVAGFGRGDQIRGVKGGQGGFGLGGLVQREGSSHKLFGGSFALAGRILLLEHFLKHRRG